MDWRFMHKLIIIITCRLSCLDRVQRSAARLIGKIEKFDHVNQYMLDVLHWQKQKQNVLHCPAAH